mmetsp:Transcript_32624/g.92503  ORF Transcript_32624/g.92503 Transcript_32624/m.92503 type:complete len:640 (-) Transcript_32624:377-2296(-)
MSLMASGYLLAGREWVNPSPVLPSPSARTQPQVAPRLGCIPLACAASPAQLAGYGQHNGGGSKGRLRSPSLPKSRNPRTGSFQGVSCAAIARDPADVSGVQRNGAFPGNKDFQRFVDAKAEGKNLVPLYARIMSDQLTPVTAYRCLVKEDNREDPSFLFESVVNGDQMGRFSHIGAQPTLEIVSKAAKVSVIDHRKGTREVLDEADPMDVPVRLSKDWRPAVPADLPTTFTGGWVGYCGYDTVRYVYGSKLPFSSAPPDDRDLPEMHLALYQKVVVFDASTKMAYAVVWVDLDEHSSLEAAYTFGQEELSDLRDRITKNSPPSLAHGDVDIDTSQRPKTAQSNMTKDGFLAAVQKTKEYILSGDIFQLVLSQRFERRTFADPFEIYRALRVINPSPYMVYLQARGSIIVASSPEILCRVDEDRVVTNRPLAGTRRRGTTPEEDKALEENLLADEKEIAEHVMLVDLGRNDVGKVAADGSVKVERLMDIERYSHVMHISSTVTGKLQPQLDSWDALRAALPVGTVSGAPKVRAMQIIDELEVNQRGPYGGGMGYVSFTGSMDMALALRTMVIPTKSYDTLFQYCTRGGRSRREWAVHIQSGAGLVADSVPESEYEETVNKAAALGRAVDLAEQAFVNGSL